MQKRLTGYLIASLSSAVIAFTVIAASNESMPTDTIGFTEQQLDVKVEIASTREQRERGLMHRTTLGENSGMLFVYPDEAPRRVWMKNTLIPLDVLFLGADGRIVSMLNGLPPCASDPCPIYNSKVSARYMLELNAGFIGDKHLKIDQQLRLPAASD